MTETADTIHTIATLRLKGSSDKHKVKVKAEENDDGSCTVKIKPSKHKELMDVQLSGSQKLIVVCCHDRGKDDDKAGKSRKKLVTQEVDLPFPTCPADMQVTRKKDNVLINIRPQGTTPPPAADEDAGDMFRKLVLQGRGERPRVSLSYPLQTINNRMDVVKLRLNPSKHNESARIYLAPSRDAVRVHCVRAKDGNETVLRFQLPWIMDVEGLTAVKNKGGFDVRCALEGAEQSDDEGWESDSDEEVEGLLPSLAVDRKQLGAISYVFDMIDVDGSGEMDAEEVMQFLSDMGQTDATNEDAEEFLARYDEDGDGSITKVEFVKGCAEKFDIEHICKVATIRREFDRFDRDGNGELDAEEVEHFFLKVLGDAAEAAAQAKDFMEQLDVDKSGEVDWSEFLTYALAHFDMLHKGEGWLAWSSTLASTTVEWAKNILSDVWGWWNGSG